MAVSSLFYEKVLKPGIPADDPRYRNALFHLLCSQTSCYRYWGQGIWTDYGREICRRLEAILVHVSDFLVRLRGISSRFAPAIGPFIPISIDTP
ncbi:MAG TPA: hypothetical protein VGD81_11140 [Opitutaceae bacterium]